jgi:multimeric flavodoxin WrbA
MAALNIMALYGSPRRGGNTEMLLDEFLRGATSEGASVDRLYIHDAAIAPCRGCQACFQSGRCIIDDDMEQIYPRLLAADIVVLASPIFFYGVTGGTKVLIDRAQALWGRRYVLKDPALGKAGKKRAGFFISAGGTKGPKMFEGAILTVKYFFDAFNVRYAGELLVRQVDAKGDVLKQTQALADAFAAGRRLVQEFRGQD